jgi:predicted phage baseplate assembly protein
VTRPWWDQPDAEARIADGAPVLIPGGRRALLEALRARIPGFTPEWRDFSDEDAGFALVRLFGAQLEPVAQRAGRLGEKALIEYLRMAGIDPAPPRPARAFVRFEPRPRNLAPVLVHEGFRLSSPRADGGRGEVLWETEDALSVGNISLAEMLAFDGAAVRTAKAGEVFRPFGERPAAGAAFYLGFAVTGAPGGMLALLFEAAAAGTPAPASEGGAPPAEAPQPVLRWEALTDRGFVEADVIRDDSARLARTGISVVKLPARWQAGRPAVAADGPPLHWLRLRLANGAIRSPLILASVHLHVVAAIARETHREEFPVRESEGRSTFVRLARTSVLPGSTVLEVDEGVASANLFDFGDDASGTGGFRRWREVATLAGQPADGRVFVLDAGAGIIRFGDQREGMAPPQGSRNIVVRAYATTLGGAGNVGAGEIGTMTSALAGIQAVSNPLPASGGADAETAAAAIARGPERVKVRGRAVTAGDVALLATEAEGADIVRAYALACADPAFPGAVRPGTVGVFVIARRHPKDQSAGPPVATSQTLGAVAAHLANSTGSLGARFVAANARFHQVVVQATVTVAPGRDAGAAMSAVAGALDRYLNPELSGENGEGWNLGATLRHSRLVHVVLGAATDIVSVPFLSLIVDGISHPACADVSLSRFGLPWPGRHRLLAEAEEGGP